MSNILDLEKAIITCIWLDDELKVVKLDELDPKLFEETRGKFDLVYKYREEGYPADITLSNNKLGIDIAKMLIENTNAVTLVSYSMYLSELKRIRYIQKLNGIIQRGGELKEVDLEEGIKVFSEKQGEKVYNLTKDLMRYTELVEERIRGDFEKYELDIKALDRTLGYIRPGMLLTIGGRHGVGKTNIAIKIFSNAIARRVPSLYLSSEMGYDSLIDRLVGMNADISTFDLRNGRLTPVDMAEVTDTINSKLYDKPGYVYEVARFNIPLIKELIDRLGIKFLFIDFLQMFRLETDNSETRASAMSEVITTLKEIALNKKVIIFALSQINKEGDMKESRGIEEKSDVVIRLMKLDENPRVSKIRVEIVKNRFGVTNAFNFGFNKNNCDFAQLEE